LQLFFVPWGSPRRWQLDGFGHGSVTLHPHYE
jgi:hypothetical protein